MHSGGEASRKGWEGREGRREVLCSAVVGEREAGIAAEKREAGVAAREIEGGWRGGRRSRGRGMHLVG